MAPATRPAGGRAARAGWRRSSPPASTWGSCRRWGPPRSPPRPPPRPPPAPRGCPASRCSASWPTWSSAGAAATWPWKVSGPRAPPPRGASRPLPVRPGAPCPVVTPLGALGGVQRVQRRGRALCVQQRGCTMRTGAGPGRARVVQRRGGLCARLQRAFAVQGCVHAGSAGLCACSQHGPACMFAPRGAVRISSGYLQCGVACVLLLQRCLRVCTTSLQRRSGCTHALHTCSAGLCAFAPDICDAELRACS